MHSEWNRGVGECGDLTFEIRRSNRPAVWNIWDKETIVVDEISIDME
jgi:hypothetical protein